MAVQQSLSSEVREMSAMARRGRRTIALSLARGTGVMRSILSEARARDWNLVDLQICGGELPPAIQCQGALVSDLPGTKLVRRLQKAGCPVVRLGNLPHPKDAELPAVLPDINAEGRLAAEHFAERGFRDVGYVGHVPWSNSRALYEGFLARATELGVRCHLLRFKSGLAARETAANTYRRRQGLYSDWLRDIPKPLGMLGYGDPMAAQLCFMSAQAGHEVPTEVAVLGHGNNVALCECTMPTLSSISPDVESHGQEACGLLGKLMDGEDAPAEPMFIPPSAVVVRESTDVLATPDPHVARALRFMWEHLNEDLSVSAVAEEVGISRRKLERHFRRELHRGVNVELRRKRLEQLCVLLRTTALPIADLAPMVGFKSTDYLHRTFRRAFGITPRRYRLREQGRRRD